jgi:broad specificity phosphatase PhoE
MDVYFVRHGETDGNVARRHQHPDTPLNEVGITQAETVAYEIANLKPTHFITSTQFRAVQTTKIISAYCEGIIPDTHPAFEELKRPSWLIGHRYTGLTTVWYIWRWFFGLSSDAGESYLAFLKRIKVARDYLESLPADARVVVVSHAVFTNIFIEHLCSDKPMSFGRAVRRFWLILKIRNATILHVKHTPVHPGQCAWEFVSASRVFLKPEKR